MSFSSSLKVSALANHKAQGCAICPLHALGMDKKKNCCKSFKHGKRCKKCPGKKK